MDMDFEFDKKKALALVGLLAVAGLLGYAIYYLFFKTKTPDVTQGDQAVQTGSLSRSSPAEGGDGTAEEQSSATEGSLPASGPTIVSGAGKIIEVSTVISDPNISATIGSDGKQMQYYNKLDGKFYRIDENGNKIAMTDEAFPNVKDVAWAPNKTNAIIEFPDGNKVIYDFNKQKQSSVPAHWNDLKFSSDSTQIVGKTVSPDPNQQFLFVARNDGTGAQPIEDLGTNGNKVIVNWSPNDQVIAFSKTGPALSGNADRQSILLVGKNHENFRQLTVEGLGFEPVWSPKGDRILYSSYNAATDLKPTLWVDGGTNDSVGAAKNYLSVNTWAHKCSFLDDNEIICAVPDPNKLQSGIGFAPQLATDTDDTIYKINIRTGLQIIIGKPDGDRTIEHIDISKDGSVAYLKDQNSGEIVKMPLK